MEAEAGPPHAARRRLGWQLAGIFALALLLRLLGNALLVDMTVGAARDDFSDGVEFEAIARNLVERGEFAIDPGSSTSFRAPGFPWLLAGVKALAGTENAAAARAVFCLIGALLPLATFWLARQLASRRAALLAAMLVAVYPNLAYYSLHFASEPLHTLLLVCALALLVQGLRRGSRGEVALAGVALGLAALTRPLALQVAPVLTIAAWWCFRRRGPRAVGHAAVFLLATGLTVLPWTVRNTALHGQVVLVVTNGGSTFWGANNALVLEQPALRGGWVSTNAMPAQKAAITAVDNEAARDELEWARGRAYLSGHSAVLPRLLWNKWAEFWSPFSTTPNAAFNLLVGVSYGALLPFMLIGAWLLVRPGGRPPPHGTILVLLAVAVTLAGTLVFYGSSRFRSVIEPLLLIGAAVALTRFADAVRRRRA
jgi:4-amino-4-deoxy-L-arabinose transferase-like glycosyltransferase